MDMPPTGRKPGKMKPRGRPFPKGQPPPCGHAPWTHETAPRNGGRPESAEFAAEARAGARKYLAEIMAGDRRHTTVAAFEALCNYGGFLNVDQRIKATDTLARVLATDLTAQQRERVIEDWRRMGLIAEPAPLALPAVPEPTQE